MWGIFGKPLKGAIWNTRPKTARFLYENEAVLGQVVFVPGPAFSHISEIDPGSGLIFKALFMQISKSLHIPPPPPPGTKLWRIGPGKMPKNHRVGA